jgi:hypothetical protein
LSAFMLNPQKHRPVDLIAYRFRLKSLSRKVANL